MRAPSAPLAWLASVAVLTVGCRTDDDFSPPTPPDMSALVAAYAAPTGRLDATSAVEVAQALAARVGQLKKALLLGATLIEAVEDVEAEPTATAEGGLLTTRAQALSGTFELWQQVRWACYGPNGAEAPVDPQWGRISLNTLASKAGLHPVAWGALERCAMPYEGDITQVLNGDLKAHIPWGEAKGQPFVLDFDGSWLDDAGAPERVQIDFALIEQTIALLQSTSTGSIRVEIGVEALQDLLAGGGLTVTDADGPWSCTVNPGLDGGACSLGERTVQW